MDDQDVDRAKLEILKDFILAQLHNRAAKWQNVQAAALGLFGLALLASFGGNLSMPGLAAVTAVCGVAMLTAHVALEHYEAKADRHLRHVAREMEKTKPGRRP